VGGTCGGFLCDEMVSSNAEEVPALCLRIDLLSERSQDI